MTILMGIPYFRTHPNIILWVLYPIFSLKPNKSHLDTMMYIYIYILYRHPPTIFSVAFVRVPRLLPHCGAWALKWDG